MEAMWLPGDETAPAGEPVEERRARVARALARYVNDPEALAGVIDEAIVDGLSADLDDATQRLLALEPRSERAIRMRVLVLTATMRHDEATDTLATALADQPDSEILHRLADQLAPRLGGVRPAQPLLAVVHDGPVDALALTEGLDDAPAPALAPEPSSSAHAVWRERAALAAEVLARGDVETALTAFRRIAAADREPATIAVIADALASQERWQVLIELVAPDYDPAADAGRAGLHLAEAYLALGRRSDGIALVQRLGDHVPAAEATALARRFARLGAG
ncbi:MAG: hypothetical protein ACOYNI_06395 [Acidimicrobiia bacterium]